jgi:hypothetical protein
MLAGVVRVINRMTKDEGARAGIETRRLYFKTFNDKANLQPLNAENKADKAKIIGMLKAWRSAGSLIVVEEGRKPDHEEVHRGERGCLICSTHTAALIAAALHPTPLKKKSRASPQGDSEGTETRLLNS